MKFQIPPSNALAENVWLQRGYTCPYSCFMMSIQAHPSSMTIETCSSTHAENHCWYSNFKTLIGRLPSVSSIEWNRNYERRRYFPDRSMGLRLILVVLLCGDS